MAEEDIPLETVRHIVKTPSKTVKEMDIRQIREEIKNNPSPKRKIEAVCCGVKNDLHEFEKYILTMGSPEIVLRNMKNYHSAKMLCKMRGLEEKSGLGKLLIILMLVMVLIGALLVFGPKLMQMMSGTGGF